MATKHVIRSRHFWFVGGENCKLPAFVKEKFNFSARNYIKFKKKSCVGFKNGKKLIK